MLASDTSAGKMVSTNQLNSFVHHGLEESGQVKLNQLIQKSFAEEWINSLLLSVVAELERPGIADQKFAQPVKPQSWQEPENGAFLLAPQPGLEGENF